MYYILYTTVPILLRLVPRFNVLKYDLDAKTCKKECYLSFLFPVFFLFTFLIAYQKILHNENVKYDF